MVHVASTTSLSISNLFYISLMDVKYLHMLSRNVEVGVLSSLVVLRPSCENRRKERSWCNVRSA